MKTTSYYAKLEKTIYEFDEHDIRRALIEMAKIEEGRKGKKVEFDWTDNDGKLEVTIAVINESEEKK